MPLNVADQMILTFSLALAEKSKTFLHSDSGFVDGVDKNYKNDKMKNKLNE